MVLLTMPCWYYDKKELRNTPSFRDGIDATVESRYRREGARFIIDCGTKLGLRYETCATGVVFFHRFYMFHSFKEFHRYVTAVSCLFLAGKTEETPKKCKDIMKTTRGMLTDPQFMVFGDDPKEEVITMERILLQTIKFDLMVEHPYAYLLKFAKQIKGKMDKEKAKVQKMVQMAWTFVNDSLCTMLCLLWEPEVIAISLMYLASRLSKTDITDWQGKPPGFKGKWYEAMVEDVNLELLEDVCHQVLDLYSSGNKKEDTPPPPPPKTPHPSTLPVTATKRSRSPTPGDSQRAGAPPSKTIREEKRPPSPQKGPPKQALSRSSSVSVPTTGKASRQSSHSSVSTATPGSAQPITSIATSNYSSSNPYMPQQMYSSSFMTQEGSQSIQSLIGGRTNYAVPPPTATVAAATTTPYKAQQQPSYPQQTTYPPPTYPQTYQTPQAQQPTNYTQQYSSTQQYNYTQNQTPYNNQYQQQTGATYPQQQYGTQQYSNTTQPYNNTTQPYNSAQSYTNTAQPYSNTAQSYNTTPQQQYSNTTQQYGNQYQYNTQQQNYQNYASNQNYSAPPPSVPPGPPPPSHITPQKPPGGLPPVRITGRP